MSWLSSFLHPGRAYDKAADEYKAGLDRARGTEQPFVQGGEDALGQLQKLLGGLSDPTKLQDEWSSNYETSPYATDMLQRNQQSGLDAASSQGLLGSSAATDNIQRGAGQIVSQDRQQYMDDLMKKYTTGIQGLQGIFNTGAGMAGQLGNQEIEGGNVLGGIAAGKDQAGGNLFGKGLGVLASLLKQFNMPGFGGMSSDMYGGS